MQTPNEAPQARHSAFAAAFFSLLLPGLGQAYAGRLRRAACFMVPWLVAVALIAGTAFSMGVKHFGEQLALDTAWLQYLLAGITIDLIWRFLAIVDAFMVARAPRGVQDPPLRRVGSAVGLMAIVGVLLVSHATVGKVSYGAYDTLNTISGNNDTDPTADPSQSLEPLGTLPPTLPPASLLAGETPVPTSEPIPEASAGPTATPLPDYQGGRLNILLVGTNGSLTDTLIVVSLDPDTKKVAFIGIPRDTVGMRIPKRLGAAYRNFGGVWPRRVNEIAYYAGLPAYANLFPGKNAREKKYGALKEIVSETLGIPINYYVQVDMDGFRDVVDTIGGAVVDVQLPVYDSRYASDDGRGAIKLYVPPGIHYFDGGEALAYSRSRHGSSDFDRSARQMRMITALRNQVDLPSLVGQLDQLQAIIKRDIRTDIPPGKLAQMADLAQGVNLDDRISLVLGAPAYSQQCGASTEPICVVNRQYALVARVSKMQQAVEDVFSTDPKTIERQQTLDSEAAVVHFMNGTKGSNQRTTNIADYFDQQGIDSSVPPINAGKADREDYTDSIITAYNGSADSKPETLKLLEDKLGVTSVTADDPSQTADIVVIVGKSAPNLKPKSGQ